METVLPACTKCRVPVQPDFCNQPYLSPCPGCSEPLQVRVYPAFFRPITVTSGESLLVQGESGCFYHPEKKAVLPCDSCGRFLCALCDVEFNSQHLCPACMQAGNKKGKIRNLQNHRTRYDNIALALAIFPLLIFYFTFITAPGAIFVAIRYWNAPGGIIPRSQKLRFVIAIILASLQIVGWIVGIYFLSNYYLPNR